MANMRRIKPEEIKLNMCFSAPVFFDDGKNMFLAPGKTVKNYHMAALQKWEIPYLLTAGREVDMSEGLNIQKMVQADTVSEVEELEEIEEVEELGEIEEL